MINAAAASLEKEPPFTSPQDYDPDDDYDDEEGQEAKFDYEYCVLETKECLALIGGDNTANNSAKSSRSSTFDEMKCETQTTLIKPPP